MPVHPLTPLPPATPVVVTQGTLALDLQPRLDPPPAEVVPLNRGRRQSIEVWARRFAQAAVEIVGGDRPASQLARWTSREVYVDLHRRAHLVARAGGHQPGAGRVQPVSPRVASVRATFVEADRVEASVRVSYGKRSRAIAARFELKQERWICTALEFA